MPTPDHQPDKSKPTPKPPGWNKFDDLMRGVAAVPKEEADGESAKERKAKKKRKK